MKKSTTQKTMEALYKAADSLEEFFDKELDGAERRADHSVLKLRGDLLEYADFLKLRV